MDNNLEVTIEGQEINKGPINHYDFTFSNKYGTIFTIKPDGTLEMGPAFTTNDEASQEFWATIRNMRDLYMGPRQEGALTTGEKGGE